MIAVAVLLVLMAPLRHGFTDDGFIHVQYARNLMTHGEYSFNSGEVSFGTTSPLWVMTLAALARPFSTPEILITLSRMLSWLAAAGAVLVVRRSILAFGGTQRVALFGAVAFAADAWLVRWSALGMESSAAACAAALAVLWSARAFDDRAAAMRFGAAVGIGALIRPEFYLALPVFIVAAATARPRPRAAFVLAGVAVAAALVVPWLAFARWHIGSFLPSTAGAKSGGWVTGPAAFVVKLAPVAKIALATQAVAVAAMLADLVVSRRDAFVLRRTFRFASLWTLALPLAYVAVDIQILSRYLLLITPALCTGGWLALENALARVAPGRARAAALAAVCVALGVNVAFYARVVLPPSRAFSADLTGNMADLARYLRDHSAPDAVVAAADIGYLAFYSERRVLDLGGLVEPRMARLRERHDYETIVAEGLYFGVDGYPHVDYLVDREHDANRFDGKVVNGHRFDRVYTTTVRNLGIRKPGDYFYTLYRIQPEGAP